MPQLDARRTYSDGSILYAADLDAIIDDIETLLNTTGLNDDNIQNAGITASTKLIDSSISTGKIASSAITTAKIADDAVTAAKIADGAIDDAAKLASDVVTTAKILASNVTTAKIADSNVTTAKIADSNVTTAKIADSNVTTAKIADSNVTTAKIADGAVTQAKRATATSNLSSSSSTFATASGVLTAVTNLTFNLTTTGRPLLLMLVPDASGNEAFIGGDAGDSVTIQFLRDSTEVGRQVFYIDNTLAWKTSVAGAMAYDAAAGTYTYNVKASVGGAGSSAKIYYAKLLAVEL